MRLRKHLITALVMISTSVPGWAATYYVAPQGTTISPTANGSETKPWGSIGSALKVAKGGDTILLMDGLHGGLKIHNIAFESPVTIRSMNGKKARLEWILLQGTTSNYVFSDLSIWPSNPDILVSKRLIETYASVANITFDNFDVRGSADAASYPSWTLEQWNKRNVNAFFAGGPRTRIINSQVTGISFGIQTLGNDSLIANNRVAGFSGDALRALGQKNIVRNNNVTDCVQINDNHADGFQSWKQTVPVDGLVLDGNKILEWSNSKSSPLRCKLQGIGLFDGFYENLVIQNNIVSVSAFHGISVYGARNAKIINNTVVSASGNPAKSPSLKVFPHKDGTPSTDVMVANNLAMSFAGTSNPTNRVASVSNTVITYPATMFTDVKTFNYVPKAASGYIDTANMLYAPKTDIMGTSRPQGKGPDRGALEVGSSTTTTTTSTSTQTTAKFLTAP
jgi:parallel beta-helix repeat protein